MPDTQITTYPLDGITYDAADAAGYCATRTSGVYSAEADFAVTPAGGMRITVSAGQAWVHPARWVGYSIQMRTATTLEMPVADGSRGRIDRVVLRFDAATRGSRIQVLQGAVGTSTPPELTRSARVYDLCLAQITRPGGSTSISAGQITDTRADEALCGLMRDGVTGIPTAQLQAEARAKVAALEESATASAKAAKASETAAAASAAQAAKSQQAAKASEQAAKTSETASSASAGQAAKSQQAAKTSETASASAQAAAANSASAAKASEQAAAASAAKSAEAAKAAVKEAADSGAFKGDPGPQGPQGLPGKDDRLRAHKDPVDCRACRASRDLKEILVHRVREVLRVRLALKVRKVPRALLVHRVLRVRPPSQPAAPTGYDLAMEHKCVGTLVSDILQVQTSRFRLLLLMPAIHWQL